MAIKRKAQAEWNGNGKEGKGKLTSTSGVLNQTPYSFNQRFGDEPGTNPEELLAAAHAGCFSMKLAFNFQAAEITPESIQTSATVVLDEGTITEVILETKVKAPVDQAKLEELVNDAKANCPVSKLFNAKISVTASLI